MREISHFAGVGKAPGQGVQARGDHWKTRASSRINYIGGRVEMSGAHRLGFHVPRGDTFYPVKGKGREDERTRFGSVEF